MGQSFVIHPSIGKALTLVGEGGFERWCLGMVMILVVVRLCGAMSTVKIWGEKFVGHGLNQGSKQREYLFLEMCQNQNQKDKMRHK